MINEALIKHCFDEHVKDIGGKVYFTYEDYRTTWIRLIVLKKVFYWMKNKDDSACLVSIVYYPLPEHKDLRALIEVVKVYKERTSTGEEPAFLDLREVPVKYLIG